MRNIDDANGHMMRGPRNSSLHGTTAACHGCCRLGGNSRASRAVAVS
jgi:hypothetical protein